MKAGIQAAQWPSESMDSGLHQNDKRMNLNVCDKNDQKNT